jgi:molybdopterin converting factor small subunit
MNSETGNSQDGTRSKPMKVSVRYFGQARQLAGVSGARVDVSEDASVNDVLALVMVDANEQLRAVLVDADGKLNSNVLAAVQDEAIDPTEKGLLKENDEIVLHTALAGG